MAVRSGRYKVVWRSQLFVGKKEDEPTSKTFCAGTGNCCVDTPTRLCNCQWATNYDPPIVIDLITNPSEDPTAAITNPEVLLAATKIRDDRVRDVMIARGFPFEGLTTEEQLDYLREQPNLMQVDYCAGPAGHLTIPPQDQQGCLVGVSDTMTCPLVPKELYKKRNRGKRSIISYDGLRSIFIEHAGEEEDDFNVAPSGNEDEDIDREIRSCQEGSSTRFRVYNRTPGRRHSPESSDFRRLNCSN